MELNNKKVMVVGTGISGIGAIDLLNKAGADCIILTVTKSFQGKIYQRNLKAIKQRLLLESCQRI